MKAMGLQGVVRGKPLRTTVQDKKQPCPLDHVNRIFKADRPNQLWVSDFTYVRTWMMGWTPPDGILECQYAKGIV
jgi:putative transposase